MKSRIYLDHAATTPARPQAIAALAAAAAVVGNPSSVHSGGRTANGIVETARDRIAAWAGCRADAIIFTSGGTEALALALNTPQRVLAGATEHSAVLAARPDAALVPVDADGVIDLAALAALLAAGPALVAVQHANNETGVVQPIAEVAALVAAAGSRLLVDAVQSAGKLPLPHADFVAISAHKLGGVPGTGALIARDPAGLTPVQRGGGQERGHRGGTPNLPGIAAFAAAIDSPADWNRVAVLRETLEARLAATIHGAGAPRLPNISNIALPGVAAATQVMRLDLAGIMVSAGAACSSGKVHASHVLAAMGLGDAAGEAIRVSLGPDTLGSDIDAFAAAWLAMAGARDRHAA
ncbi:aminotransferase class V-fold PLP-dependent enzyme [Polymorphobacter fuscus]|uniref:Cysteine desulfurase n=1 Tax=Sandarakinorhabdus fusca TaxID=1439888 RepID=A0A7C9GNS1_9SPHN|nr:aminotransferase class V-fold PLP-dependent enzyme [Polymorphobacter fuscus]MQT16416.1 aminotransferase class V-fold PLP-dependent enzyme [Polymorphobacter fuscus]